MWDRNLGLNRKITKVISENLNDTNSEIYKEISDISGEYTESNDIAKMIEGNRDSITSFVNEDITELGDYAFKDCVNLEYVYLPNCTKLGKECFQNCTSLKTLLLPSVTEIDIVTDNYFSSCINLENLNLSSFGKNNMASTPWESYEIVQSPFNSSSLYKLKILSLGMVGCADEYSFIIPSNVEILVLTHLECLGSNSGFKANNIIIPYNVVGKGSGAYFDGIMYVNKYLLIRDDVTDYANGTWRDKYNAGEILPISQLPQEIREELELCQIQI